VQIVSVRLTVLTICVIEAYPAYCIVKDCETIRKILIGDKEKLEDRKWTILGQSFGGFCALTYLSFYSEGLKEVFLTGGLAPLVDRPDPVYEVLISWSSLLTKICSAVLIVNICLSQSVLLKEIASTTRSIRKTSNV
jgi:pimeloyl-ACP methyl ester carboxylesterase